MFNGEQIFFTDQNLNGEHSNIEGSITNFQYTFKNFLHSYERGSQRPYYTQLKNNIRNNKYFVVIELSDLKAYDENLFEKFVNNPIEMLRVMEEGVKMHTKEKKEEFSNFKDTEWQVIMKSQENSRRIRQISSTMVGKVFNISGIIISGTKPYIKAKRLKVKCRNCSNIKIIDLSPGENPYVPKMCPGQNGRDQKCPNDPFVAMPDSEVIDMQHMKIQQFPEDVPNGEIARTYHVICDRQNVNKCVPGDRVTLTGVMMVHDMQRESLSKGYLYMTGVEKIRERSGFTYTEHEEEIFKNMSKDPNIYHKIYKSIAPGIYGNEEIKKAIACMLFGGSRKELPDKTNLRGDINILLIGDPSTAKSQFLKFVEQAASIAIYTSGKGSSAAGLTASITKDQHSGEFQIEGGALVLADGGIVCIDEFDKMKQQDRVAIHEAMEQQTISIAKAGITTRLNSRTSILAAANPIFGRYDDLRQIEDQIQLQTTILSRFDCIFIVRDINTPENNQRIASHILNLHQGKSMKQEEAELPFDLLKKYIKYAKSKFSPSLSASVCEKLQSIYVADRQKSRQQKKVKKNSIPITVRQLEAIIRISESLAKMKLKTEVGQDEVDEAHYLFQVSTMKTIDAKEFGYVTLEGVSDQIEKIEEAIKKRICIGNQVTTVRLVEDLSVSYNDQHIQIAVRNMIKNKDLRQIKGNKMMVRQK